MGFLSVVHVVVQAIICIKLTTSQSSLATFRLVKKDATIVGVEPFYNQKTISLTECYLACLQQIERCLYIEVANVNEAWSCKLFHFYIADLKKHLNPSKGSDIAASPHLQFPKDCVEVKQLGFNNDGVYSIMITKDGSPIKVYCDVTTDGGGWIVIQKRFDGSVDFTRNWTDYKNGFGNLSGEYWLGNEFVHKYTTMHQTEMKITAIAFNDDKASAKLEKFRLGDESSKYIFDYDGGCEGLCTFTDYKGRKFSTSDQDNDNSNRNCALEYFGGWWFENCFLTYLNGMYSKTETVTRGYGIHWYAFRDHTKSLKETKMMIRQMQ